MIGVIDVGGGNRGAFGAGVLDYCLDKGIQFDYCIGVSAGSANCVSYIAGQKGRNLRFYTNYNISKDAISIRNRLKYHSMLNLDYIFRTVSNEDGEDPLNYDAFVRSGQALRIVATDAETGRPVFFDKNDVERNNYRTLCASCNLPVVNRAYQLKGKAYYDGGLSDPIPVDRALRDGCDKVVVILTLPKNYFRDDLRDRRVARFVRACGAKAQTVSGLSGIGDLIVTCTSRHSRNHAVGERLGRGEKIADITASMQMVAEGVWNAHVVRDRARELGVEMPIVESVYRVCHEDLPVSDAIAALMGRPLKCE